MKKIAIAAIIAFAVSNVGISALAAEDNTLKNQAGITPDSILYPVDKAIDSIKVMLTFSNAKKAEVLMKIADERLGESEAMSDKNKTDLAEKALESYNETIDKAHDKLEQAEKDVENENEQSKLDKVQDAEKTMLERTTKDIDVLKKVEEKASEDVKAKIQAVIDMQTTKKEAVANMVDKRHALNDARQTYNQLTAQLEAAKKSGDQEAIKNLENQLNTAQSALTLAQDEFKKAFEAKQQAIKDANKAKKEAMDALKNKKNESTTEQDKIKAQQKDNKVDKEKKDNGNKTSVENKQNQQQKSDEIKAPSNNQGNVDNDNNTNSDNSNSKANDHNVNSKGGSNN